MKKRIPITRGYYFSIRERITVLLNSVYGKFLKYKSMRKMSEDGNISDVYDSRTWKEMEKLVPENGIMIGIQVLYNRCIHILCIQAYTLSIFTYISMSSI